PLILNHRFGGVDAQVVQRVSGGFERINFPGGQLIGGGFVPVRPIFVRMICQADLLDLLAPVGPGDGTMPLHHEWMKYDRDVLPKPPRTTTVRCASACCTMPGAGVEMF